MNIDLEPMDPLTKAVNELLLVKNVAGISADEIVKVIRAKRLHIHYGASYRELTRTGMVEEARRWMKDQSKGCEREWYFTRLGLLIDFVTDLTDPKS